MTAVFWTTAALSDLEEILIFAAARNPQGAATIAARVEQATIHIGTFPEAARRDPATGAYEWVVRGIPLLLIYELVTSAGGTKQADIIAVFHTSRDPEAKPGRRQI